MHIWRFVKVCLNRTAFVTGISGAEIKCQLVQSNVNPEASEKDKEDVTSDEMMYETSSSSPSDTSSSSSTDDGGDDAIVGLGVVKPNTCDVAEEERAPDPAGVVEAPSCDVGENNKAPEAAVETWQDKKEDVGGCGKDEAFGGAEPVVLDDDAKKQRTNPVECPRLEVPDNERTQSQESS